MIRGFKTTPNFYQLLVVIVISNKKQTITLILKRGTLTENFTIFFFKCRKNWKRAGIQIWQILVDHLLEMI